jgi:hypothetical protein
MTNPQAELYKNFRPTDAQISEAVDRCLDLNVDSVFVPVNFPDKQRGLWTEGQVREEVRDEYGFLVFWIKRDDALRALTSGNRGNAVFRVWADRYVGLVDEA